MKKADRAEQYFRKGFNCSQAVLPAFSPRLGIRIQTASKIAQAFGAGMARSGETCGAVTGGLMVLGLRYGKTRARDDDAKEKTYALVHKFLREFSRRHGSLLCRRLLGAHPGTARGQRIIKKKRLHETLCPQFVRTAAELVQRFL